MTNFWTKEKEKLYECFLNPKTIDYDFDKKKQEFSLIKNKVFKIKEILLTIEEKTNGLHFLFSDIYNYFNNIFDIKSNENYEKFMNDTSKAHIKLDEYYNKN